MPTLASKPLPALRGAIGRSVVIQPPVAANAHAPRMIVLGLLMGADVLDLFIQFLLGSEDRSGAFGPDEQLPCYIAGVHVPIGSVDRRSRSKSRHLAHRRIRSRRANATIATLDRAGMPRFTCS